MKKVLLYVLDGMAEWEVGNILQALGMQVQLNGKQDFLVQTVGYERTPIRTLGGLTIVPDSALVDIDDGEVAALLLPGADAWDDARNQAVLDKAEALLAQGAVIGAICGATLALADRGLLNRFEHTSNSREYLEMFSTNYSGQHLYREENSWADSNLITANSAAGLQWAKRILEQLGVYPQDIIDIWYLYYSTGNPEHFLKLMSN